MTEKRSGRVFWRIAAASSGETNGVLYSSANRSAGSTVPCPPPPPTSSGGRRRVGEQPWRPERGGGDERAEPECRRPGRERGDRRPRVVRDVAGFVPLRDVVVGAEERVDAVLLARVRERAPFLPGHPFLPLDHEREPHGASVSVSGPGRSGTRVS